MAKKAGKTGKKLKNRLLNGLRDAPALAAVMVAAACGCLALLPPVLSVLETLLPKGIGAGATARVWLSLLFSSARFWEPLLHSLLCAFCAALAAVPVGAAGALLLLRTRGAGRSALRALLLWLCAVPAWMKAAGWLALFRGGGGGPGGVLAGLGAPVPRFLSAGPAAFVLCMALHCWPFSCLLISAALRSVNPAYEEAAAAFGAGRGQILRQITLPLSLPAAAASACLAAGECAAECGAALLLCVPAGYETLATSLFREVRRGSQASACALALVLFGLTALIFYEKRSFPSPPEGEGAAIRSAAPVRGRRAALALLLLCLTAALPLFALAAESFQLIPGGGFGADNLTTLFWTATALEAEASAVPPGILQSGAFYASLWETAGLCAAAAAAAFLLGRGAVWAALRSRGRVGSFAWGAAWLPALTGGAALSAMYAAAAGRLPLPALAVSAAAAVAYQLPFAANGGGDRLRRAAAAMEASGLSGGGTGAFAILVRGGVLEAVLPMFLMTLRELDLFLLLPSSRGLSVFAFTAAREGDSQTAGAVCAVLLAMLSAGLLVIAVGRAAATAGDSGPDAGGKERRI